MSSAAKNIGVSILGVEPGHPRRAAGGAGTPTVGSERTRFRREKIGFTFQSNNLLPYLTARENVALMLRLNGKFEKRANAASRNCWNDYGYKTA